MIREKPEVIRLKRYKSHLLDGPSSIEYEPAVKGDVIVAVVLGSEPAAIADLSELLDVPAAIRRLAKELDCHKKTR